jgi:hypothetical protein
MALHCTRMTVPEAAATMRVLRGTPRSSPSGRRHGAARQHRGGSLGDQGNPPDHLRQGGLSFIDAFKPAVLSPAGEDGEILSGYRYLIMPIRESPSWRCIECSDDLWNTQGAASTIE